MSTTSGSNPPAPPAPPGPPAPPPQPITTAVELPTSLDSWPPAAQDYVLRYQFTDRVMRYYEKIGLGTALTEAEERNLKWIFGMATAGQQRAGPAVSDNTDTARSGSMGQQQQKSPAQQVMSFMSKMKVPSFSGVFLAGTVPVVEFVQWRQHLTLSMNQCFELLQISESAELQRLIMRTVLSASALEHFNSTASTGVFECDKYLDELADRFVGATAVKNAPRAIATSLLQLRQEGNGLIALDHYTSQFKRLQLALDSKPVGDIVQESLLRSAYLNGLTVELRKAITALHNELELSLGQLQDKARELCVGLPIVTEQKTIQVQVNLASLVEPGEPILTFPEESALVFVAFDRNSGRKMDMRRVKCYRCQGFGHFARTCRRKPVKNSRMGKPKPSVNTSVVTESDDDDELMKFEDYRSAYGHDEDDDEGPKMVSLNQIRAKSDAALVGMSLVQMKSNGATEEQLNARVNEIILSKTPSESDASISTTMSGSARPRLYCSYHGMGHHSSEKCRVLQHMEGELQSFTNLQHTHNYG